MRTKVKEVWRSFELTWFLPPIITASFVAVIAIVFWQMHSYDLDSHRAHLSRTLENTAETIRRNLDADREYLLLLAEDVARGALNAETFQTRVSQYVADHPGLINVTWADAEFVIRRTAPFAPNKQVIGLKLTLPEPERASKLSRDTGRPVYTKPFVVIQGQPAFEVYVPVFRGGMFMGTFGGIYSASDVLRNAVSPSVSADYEAVIMDDTGTPIAEVSDPERKIDDLVIATRPLAPVGQGTALRLAHYKGNVNWRVMSLLLVSIGLAIGLGVSMWAHRQVTERKRSEEALRQSEERFRLVAQSTGDAIIAIDDEGRIVSWNRGAERMFGCPEGEVIGKPLTGFMPEEFRKDYEASLKRLRGGGKARHAGRTVELRGRRTDGGEFPLELSLGWWTAGGETFYSGVVRDITERKRAEAALLKAKEAAEVANRAKTEFLANMSHELRTPLNSVIGFSEMMTLEAFGPLANDTYLEYTRDINDAGNHLLEIINDILDFSRIEAGEIDFTEDELDVAKTIESCLRIISERAMKARVTVSSDVPDDFPLLYGDETRVKQILLNLLSNGVKFTRPEGRTVVEARRDPHGAIVLRVRDTGVGIPAKDIPRVLESFGQVADAMTRDHPGTGLGLSMAKSLTELHGGTLSIDSEVGVGTTVTVRFPPERVLEH